MEGKQFNQNHARGAIKLAQWKVLVITQPVPSLSNPHKLGREHFPLNLHEGVSGRLASSQLDPLTSSPPTPTPEGSSLWKGSSGRPLANAGPEVDLEAGGTCPEPKEPACPGTLPPLLSGSSSGSGVDVEGQALSDRMSRHTCVQQTGSLALPMVSWRAGDEADPGAGLAEQSSRQWLGAPPNGKAGSPLGTPSLRPCPGRSSWGLTVGPQASI